MTRTDDILGALGMEAPELEPDPDELFGEPEQPKPDEDTPEISETEFVDERRRKLREP